jgi:hypothetical protein
MIRRFLGEPDARFSNPYGTGVIRCWRPARVAELERTAAVQDAKALVRRRSAAGGKARETRLERLEARARTMMVTVRKIDAAELLRLAIDAENGLRAYRARRWPALDPVPLTLDSRPDALRLAMRTYALRRLVDCDRQLEASARAAGADQALEIIEKKIIRALDEAYPGVRGPAQRRRAAA